MRRYKFCGECGSILGRAHEVEPSLCRRCAVERLDTDVCDIGMMLRRVVRKLPAGKLKTQARDLIRRKCPANPARKAGEPAVSRQL